MFKKKRKPLKVQTTRPVQFVSGAVVRTEKGIFYIKGNRRYRVSERIVHSWNFPRPPVEASEANLLTFKVAGRLGFRNGTVVRDVEDSAIYVIADNKRYRVTDPDQLILVGAGMDDIITVAHKEVLLHEDGGKLNV